jgi:hypothetical protein
MATKAKAETGKSTRGKVVFEAQSNGKTLAVHMDKPGFRRLLESLERLAETGEPQRFEKSGRARPGVKNGAISHLLFQIDGDG